MAAEENNPKAEEILDQKKDAAHEVPAGETCPAAAPPRKSGKAGLISLIVILAAAGVFAVPEVREKAKSGIDFLTASLSGRPSEEIREVALSPEPENIENRLEQLENARDFDNAKLVASVEPVQADMRDKHYEDLLEQQAALLAEIGRLQALVLSMQADTARQITSVREDMPKTGLIEERLLMMAAKNDALELQIVENGAKMDRIDRNKADAASVLALLTRMEATEQKLKASSIEKERAAALLLAVYQLREAALSGQSFLMEQQAALALAAFQPRIAARIRALSVAADQGVWSKTALTMSFGGFADRAVQSEQLSSKTDWFHKALNSLRGLVVVRRIDAPAEDPSTQAVIARAQQAVNDGDLPIALLQLKDLKPGPAAVMKEWIIAAERHILTKKAVTETVSAVLGVLYAQQIAE